jgi:NADH dehydrogenase FAD-containing subunit
MAYVGQNKAAAQVSMLKSFLPNFMQKLPIVGEDIVLTGGLAELVWKVLYLDMQVSNKNKLQVAFDWIKVGLFGRCVSRY